MGDEEPVPIIIENGSFTIKAGPAGDKPQTCFRSVISASSRSLTTWPVALADLFVRRCRSQKQIGVAA